MQLNNIICIGEILWDSMPKGLFLGGAPFNVAVHLKNLGNKVDIVSGVGDDELGREILRRVNRNGISTDFISINKNNPTGFVKVDLDKNDNPQYDIIEEVAWDYIENEELNGPGTGTMVVFGSLAQRNSKSRKTIQELIKKDVFPVFDINLRPPYDNKDIVEESLKYSWLVKFNDAELKKLAEWYSLPDDPEKASQELCSKYGCQIVCITMADKGASLYKDNTFIKSNGLRVKVSDTVGSGDAFLAGLLNGLIREWPMDQVLSFANATGAFVATQDGATPQLDLAIIQDLQK